jgi:hypothetical protein
MAKLYFIVPFNEGQQLNYSEAFKGYYENAKKRAKSMKTGLRRCLPQATISVEIHDESGRKIKEVV